MSLKAIHQTSARVGSRATWSLRNASSSRNHREILAGLVGLAKSEAAFGIVNVGRLGAHFARYGLPQPPVEPRQSA